MACGAKVETVGFEANLYDPNIKRTASQLLQETKSAVDVAVRLEQAIAQAK